MTLSETVKRKPIHTRQLVFEGYEREDGLFDIEGKLIDSKPFDIDNEDRGGQIKAGESLHQMVIRVTVDESMKIIDAQAATEWAPFDYCQGGAASFHRLVGEKMGPGWTLRVKEILGGTDGCTHITEMLGQLATTAFQSIYGRDRARRQRDDSKTKPAILDSCHALASDSPVVARFWPNFYQPKNS